LEVTQKKGISAENRDGEAAARLHVPARELFWMPPEEPFTKRSVPLNACDGDVWWIGVVGDGRLLC
jgi:hypothetical protein